MLGKPHAVTDDRRVRADVDFGAAADLRLLDPRGGDEVGPRLRLDIGLQRIKTRRVFRDEIMVEDGFAGGLALEQTLHHADRKRVVSGQSVSARVVLGGPRLIRKKNPTCTYIPTFS